MKLTLGVVIPGVVVICFHCIVADEVVDYNEIKQNKEQDMDKRAFDQITPLGLNGFVKRRFDSIAHNRGFSGFTDKRLYGIEDSRALSSPMKKRTFDSISYGPLSGFVKKSVADLRNNDRMIRYIQRPIYLVGGIGPNVLAEQPVDAVFVGGSNRPVKVSPGSQNTEYFKRWYNLMSRIRLAGYAKRSAEVVDGELLY